MKASKIEIYRRPDNQWGWREVIVGRKVTCAAEGNGFVSAHNAERNFVAHQKRMAAVAFRRVIVETNKGE
jgi:hypothetical protein